MDYATLDAHAGTNVDRLLAAIEAGGLLFGDAEPVRSIAWILGDDKPFRKQLAAYATRIVPATSWTEALPDLGDETATRARAAARVRRFGDVVGARYKAFAELFDGTKHARPNATDYGNLRGGNGPNLDRTLDAVAAGALVVRPKVGDAVTVSLSWFTTLTDAAFATEMDRLAALRDGADDGTEWLSLPGCEARIAEVP